MLVWTFHTLQSDSQDLPKVNSTLKSTRNTSRLVLTPKTWKLCTPSAMLLSVLIQLLSQRKRRKSTRRDGTEPESHTPKEPTVSHKSKLHSFVPKPQRNKCSD